VSAEMTDAELKVGLAFHGALQGRGVVERPAFSTHDTDAMRSAFVTVVLLLLIRSAAGQDPARPRDEKPRSVMLSNTRLPLDERNRSLITGEADILKHSGGFLYFYFNNWGACAGVDCCRSAVGCRDCCFLP